MICKYCGTQVSEGSEFCKNCGKPVEKGMDMEQLLTNLRQCFENEKQKVCDAEAKNAMIQQEYQQNVIQITETADKNLQQEKNKVQQLINEKRKLQEENESLMKQLQTRQPQYEELDPPLVGTQASAVEENQEKGPRLCPNCGQEADDECVFCIYCGARLPV